jgi:hypothetical protein
MQDLVEAHGALHAKLEDDLYAVLASLTALDVAAAEQKLADFDGKIAAHMRWEDETVLPVYATVAPKDGPGRADHVAGDHTILARNLAAAFDAIDALDEKPTLRAVLAMLPIVYRVLSVLEHHTLREQNNVYPAFATQVDDAARDDALTVLRSLAGVDAAT